MSRVYPTGDDARTRAAVESVYEVFECPTPPVIVGCPCCVDTRKVDVLLSSPLRELSGSDLWRYITGAFYTIGAERDFRYLLPRILELSLADNGGTPDAEIVLNKLRLANWDEWPVEERSAVLRLLDSWIDLAIGRDTCEDMISRNTESVLCGAVLAGVDLMRWRDRLAHPDAAAVVEDFRARQPRDWSAFWKDCPNGLDHMRALVAAL